MAMMYVSIAIFSLLAILLIFIFSSNNYTINVIIDIILLIALCLFSIYFFSIIFSDCNNKANYFERVKSGQRSKYIVTFDKDLEDVIQDKLLFSSVSLNMFDGINSTNAIFIEYGEKYNFQKDIKYEITCCGRLIISIEVKK